MSFPNFVRSNRESILSAALAEPAEEGIADRRAVLSLAIDVLVRAVERTFQDSAASTKRAQAEQTIEPGSSLVSDVDSNSLDAVAFAALSAYASVDRERSGEIDRSDEHVSVEVLDLPSIGFELLCSLQLPLTSRTAEATRSSISTVRRFTASRPPPPKPSIEPSSSPHDEALLGTGSAMRRVRATLTQLARRSRAPVLLIGEAGTGKRSFAQQLHRLTYVEGEFFELTLADQMSELARRIATSRTRNARVSGNGFTLYASNIARFSPAIQAQLVAWLEQSDLQMRLVASVVQPLVAAVREGSVSSQLTAKLSVHVELPPLRERKEDLRELFECFARRVAQERPEAAIRLSASALTALEGQDWPGNVTELFALVARLAQTTGSGVVEAEQVQLVSRTKTEIRLPREGINLSDLEKNLLQQALTLTSNNQTRAALLLGLTRDQLRYRLAKFEIAASPLARTG